jgi:O-antigen/teichoic acid export membrane protein
MKPRVALTAGVTDAAVASLATFVCGLYASAQLTDAELGAYALFFTGFIVAGVVPAQLVFTPLEVQLVDRYEPEQLESLSRTTLVGGVPSFISSTLVVLFIALVAGLQTQTVLALGSTTLVASALSPVQDHVRRMLHQAKRSQWALHTSMVQFGVVCTALAVLHSTSIGRAWVPMGALAIANVASLIVGLSLADRTSLLDNPVRLELRRSTEMGRWLMYSSLAQSGALLLSLLIVNRIAGSEEAGFFEASRQISQPIWVLGTGLLAVLRPPVMRAAESGRPEPARAPKRSFFTILGTASVVWLVVAGFDVPANPVRWALNMVAPAVADRAYEVGGLVFGITLGAALWSMTLIVGAELIAGGRARGVFVGHLAGSLLMVGIVFITAESLGAWAIPFGVMAQFIATVLVYRREVDLLYAGASETIGTQGSSPQLIR